VRRYDNMGALKQLLELDTTIFREALYQPWYTAKSTVIKIISAWLFSLILITALVTLFTEIHVLITLGIMLLLTLGAGLFLFTLIKKKLDQAKQTALAQIMRLENKGFMKAMSPFVPKPYESLIEEITEHKIFTPDDYISIVATTQRRVIKHTDEFVKDVERMLEDPSVKIKPPLPNDDYSETTFKVPDSAKQKYDDMKNASSFSDEFSVSPQAKAAILAKIMEAINHAALGRNIHLARIKQS